MPVLRKTIFWLHVSIAAGASLIIAIMAVTGVLLTYQRQMTSWLDLRALDGGPPTAEARMLPAAEIVKRAQTAQKAAPSALRWRAKADAPVEVRFSGGERVFVNGYTGQVLGTGSYAARMFFGTATRLHTSLGIPRRFVNVGLGITSVANLAFLLLLVSGSFLWWPQRWKILTLRNQMLFRRGLRAKARDFNWHHVFGFWSAIPLVIIVFSGVVMSSPRVGTFIERVANRIAPAPAAHSAVPAPAAEHTTVADVDALVARAKQHGEWRTLTLQLQPNRRGGLVFTLDRGSGGEPQKQGRLVVAANAWVLSWQPFSAQASGRKARSILRSAHTGEVGGVAGQTIAGLASAASVMLAYTGIALALRRWLAWRRRRSAGAGPARKSRARPIPA